MQAEELTYGTYLDGPFSKLQRVRAFGSWEVLSGYEGSRSILLVINDEIHSATVCRYYDENELLKDFFWVSQLPPDDGDGSGSLAKLLPLPPTLAPGKAKPWPLSDIDR